MKNKLVRIAPTLTVVAFIGLWWMLAFLYDAEVILPSPWEVINHFGLMFKQITFYKSIFMSLCRTALSFAIAFGLGVLCAVFANRSYFLQRALYPLVVIVRATPTMSVILLCIIWFWSMPMLTPMVIAFIVIFPILYTSTLEAIKSCDEELIEMSKIYHVSQSNMVAKLYLPSVAGRLYSDSISTLMLNLKLIISAEALAQTNFSIGDGMKIAKEALETAELFAYTLCAIILSCLLESIIKIIKKIVVRCYYAHS